MLQTIKYIRTVAGEAVLSEGVSARAHAAVSPRVVLADVGAAPVVMHTLVLIWKQGHIVIC